MEVVTAHSQVRLIFTLAWKNGGISFKEFFYAGNVNMWRDVFPGRLKEALLGKQVGEYAEIAISAEQFPQVFQKELMKLVSQNQFSPVGHDGRPAALEAVPGRFYPQCFLTGVAGVFRTSTTPCRFVNYYEDKMLFDLNHPLCGKDLLIVAKVQMISNDHKERGGRCEDWLEKMSADGPGMQCLLPGTELSFFDDRSLQRADDQNDEVFYTQPRFVQHLDSLARAQIGREYAKNLPQGGAVLDLMASWDSHLPRSYNPSSLTVLGLNEEELKKNERADTAVVHNLNTSPQLPFADNSFDGIICTASIEYLIDPLSVCRDAYRVLRPGGVLAISFSNRWFAPKAVALWSQLHEFERLGMVLQMVVSAGAFESIEACTTRNFPRPEDDRHNHLVNADPVYMVTARKK